MASTWAKRVGWGVGGAILAVAAYLAAWPVPIQPVAWTAPAAPGYQGVHAPNQRLAQLNIIDLKGEVGPEHIAFGKDGKLYTTVLSGNILRMNPDGSGQEVFANTGGRVLGFDFDAAGHLIAADAIKGLLSIAPDGKVTLLADKVGNDPIRYADAVVVAQNGKMYLSDASTRFAPKDWGGTFEASVLDILEQASTGRVIEYDPATRSVRLSASHFSGRSLAAITIAAHEVGHALQHAEADPAFLRRQEMVERSAWGQRVAGWLVVAIPVVTLLEKQPAPALVMLVVGVLTMAVPLVAQFSNLPIEFDASFKRALPMLQKGGWLNRAETIAAQKILRAAAFTYVAQALSSMLNIFKWLRGLKM